MILIVVPRKFNDNCNDTILSLAKQTCKDFRVVEIIDFEGKGANWARNEGFKQRKDEEFVLFSDCDIEWEQNALERMVNKLEYDEFASYCYGSYEINGNILCQEEFDEELLKKRNYISTMTLIKSKDFPGFDEKIEHLQDWDLWLTMLEKGKIGVQCGSQIFKTKVRNGMTYNSNYILQDVIQIVKEKHNLN